MTDLSMFDYETKAEQGFDLEVLHPQTNKPTGIVIKLVGKDSQTFEKAQADFQRSIKDVGANDRDANLAIACNLIADCTVGWSGIEENGKEVPFSNKAAADIYKRYKGVREQADRAITQRSRLFQNDKED